MISDNRHIEFFAGLGGVRFSGNVVELLDEYLVVADSDDMHWDISYDEIVSFA